MGGESIRNEGTPVQPATRRQFVRQVAMAAGGMLGAATGLAIEPIQRTGKREFRLGLAAYSLRQFLQPKGGEPASLDLPGFIDYCGNLGLDGAELTSYYFPAEITPAYLKDLKSRARTAGLKISGGAIRNDFCLPPGPDLQQWITHTKRWIDIYAELEAPTIRIFSGNTPKGDTEEATIRRCIGVIEQVCEYAGQRGVRLGLENHGGLTATADTMLKIIRGVQSPWFGVNFDSGNFRGGDPYAELAEIAPYAISAQIKTEITVAGKKQAADLGRLVRILTDAGYSGWVVLEYEAAEDPYQAIPRYTQELRSILAALA